jgi:type II secretory pathway pseudopilin PulG
MTNKMNETNVWNELNNFCSFPVLPIAAEVNLSRNELPNVKIGRGGGLARKKKKRTGLALALTLVELLVVIAIIGMLIALLLPAVQAAREAARRMSCTNKIKQLSLAVHNFHDARQRFPASAWDEIWRRNNLSRAGWLVLVFPYIEQQALYEEILNTKPPGGVTYVTETTEANVSIAALLCPSDPKGSDYSPTATFTPTGTAGSITPIFWSNYRASHADLPGGDTLTSGDNQAVSPGVSQSRPRAWCQFGFITVNLDYITDGTSNSVLLGEGLIHDENNPTDYRKNLASGVECLYYHPPQNVLNLKGPGRQFANPALTIVKPNTSDRQNSPTRPLNLGKTAIGNYPCSAYFHTLLPPNSPSAYWKDFMLFQIAASSEHTGGANISFIDASVHFISDTIGTKNLDKAGAKVIRPNFNPTYANAYGDARASYAPATLTDPDTGATFSYGVWSELGTVNCGEATSLP